MSQRIFEHVERSYICISLLGHLLSSLKLNQCVAIKWTWGGWQSKQCWKRP